MPLQQWFFVRNDGPDREYMHHGLRRLPNKAVLIAPGFLTEVSNGRINWPHGAIICVDRIVWATSPALGKYAWNTEVTQDDFVALLQESVTPAPVIEPEVTETAVPDFEAEETMTQTPVEEAEPEPPKPNPKRRRGRPRKAA